MEVTQNDDKIKNSKDLLFKFTKAKMIIGNNVKKSYKNINNLTKNTIFFKSIFKYITVLKLIIISLPRRYISGGISTYNSYITLKINRKGISKIYNKLYKVNNAQLPNEVFINDKELKPINNTYNFTETTNNVKLVWHQNIESTQYLFYGCYNIVEIDLNDFNASKVTNMSHMFEWCLGLEALKLSNLDTSKVVDMNAMFSYCSNLIFLNLSSFDTSEVTNMESMFYHCSSLKSLYLSNFNTSKVTNMYVMFYHCYKLDSLNLSHFDTSNVSNMRSMFNGCQYLKSLNLSNFNTSNVICFIIVHH